MDLLLCQEGDFLGPDPLLHEDFLGDGSLELPVEGPPHCLVPDPQLLGDLSICHPLGGHGTNLGRLVHFVNLLILGDW